MTQIDTTRYWKEKLIPFKQGSRRFGRSTTEVAGTERYSAEVPESSRPDLLLPSAALIWSRYAAAEEVLIAEMTADAPLFHRIAVDPNSTVASFLRTVDRESQESRSYGGLPLTEALSLLEIESGNAGPLFEVTLLRSHGSGEGLASIALRVAASGNLNVSVAQKGDPEFAQQFAGHLALAMKFLAGNPAATLRAFHPLTPLERASHLANQGQRKLRSPSQSLHGLVADQAMRTPAATAVVYQGHSLTYAQLDDAANRLAAFLAGPLNVRPGDLVGLIVGRSERMIAAILGVLKAGAAYVPINPRHPMETVNYMLRNAGIRTLLVESDTAMSAASFRGELVFLDLELPGLPAREEFVPAAVSGGDLAYVIYTSGSTGKPKGVAIEHSAIVNTILWRNEFYGMAEDDATLQMPSYAFDSSVVDIFCSLTTGGKLVIPDEDLRLDALYLRNIVQAQGITRLIVTPSYYALLHRELKSTAAIRSVTVAGENIPLELVNSHHRHLPGVRLINEYGPTENAVCSTACELREGTTGVHIGAPIQNTQVFVLDDQLRPLPAGVPGEMYLGGLGLARGYVNQPELTAERFLPGVFDEFPGLMYKTGDWACWRRDGTLEFLGRLDNQVKVRGFRIELSEVESVLSRHPSVEMAAVLCKEDAGGGKYLAAYVASDEQMAPSDVVNWLRGQLPYYMVPDVVRVLRRLPLTLNGKVDAASLARLPDFERGAELAITSADSVIAALSALCSTLLQRGAIGMDENLFSLGANSLRVMEMVTRIRSELHTNIELLDVYAFPTIRELALRVESRGSDKAATARSGV